MKRKYKGYYLHFSCQVGGEGGPFLTGGRRRVCFLALLVKEPGYGKVFCVIPIADRSYQLIQVDRYCTFPVSYALFKGWSYLLFCFYLHLLEAW